MARPRKRDPFYFWIAIAITFTAFLGFSFTYFVPLFRGVYPRVPTIVHVHGWTYFVWYLLLPVQAVLIRSRRFPVHRTLGYASIALGLLMIFVGLIVSTVRVEMARGPEQDVFWELMGMPIFSIWVLFTVFYVAAMLNRRRPAAHSRYVILASAVALAAATFRIVVQIFGFYPWVAVVGCLVPVLFVAAAMLHDYHRLRAIHQVYAWGGAAMVGLIGWSFLLPLVPGGVLLEKGVAWLGRLLMPLYY